MIILNVDNDSRGEETIGRLGNLPRDKNTGHRPSNQHFLDLLAEIQISVLSSGELDVFIIALFC